MPNRTYTHAESPLKPYEALAYLTPDLIAVLASLAGAPRPVINATIQLLPFGSRSALQTLEPPIAEPGSQIDGELRGLRLTEFGYEVILAARTFADERPEAVSNWAAYNQAVERLVADQHR